MKRERVTSSAIKAIGYNEDKKVVEIELETERIYRYFHISVEEYLLSIEADAIGGYYNKKFKEKFPIIKSKGIIDKICFLF